MTTSFINSILSSHVFLSQQAFTNLISLRRTKIKHASRCGLQAVVLGTESLAWSRPNCELSFCSSQTFLSDSDSNKLCFSGGTRRKVLGKTKNKSEDKTWRHEKWRIIWWYQFWALQGWQTFVLGENFLWSWENKKKIL